MLTEPFYRPLRERQGPSVLTKLSDWYKVQTVKLLTPDQRLAAARRMKAELMSNNKQIAQVLSLPLNQIDLLFPVAI